MAITANYDLLIASMMTHEKFARSVNGVLMGVMSRAAFEYSLKIIEKHDPRLISWGRSDTGHYTMILETERGNRIKIETLI